MGQRKGGLFIRQVTSEMINSYEIVYNRKRKKLPFNTGDWLIKVIAWAGLTVH